MDIEKEPAHHVEAADVERRLAAAFANEGLRAAARSQLMHYGRESWHHEVARVQLAILKIAGSDLTEIDKLCARATRDYLDVLGQAEYPSYSALGEGVDDDSATARAAIRNDRRDYRAWLESR